MPEPTIPPAPAAWADITLSVNGEHHSLLVAADRRLISVLRDDLRLTGAKVGCDVGVCGACTVLMEDEPVSSCIMLAIQADGKEVRTVEGLAGDPATHRLQEAFITEGGYQCGFCTSGQLLAAAALLERGEVPSMSDDEIGHHLAGNLCRCTGYYGILRALRAAALP